ncbi:MAG: hypothetical protein SGJ00_14545 [bacterium]|nr:hypothetical protein [bacterium]
MKPITYLIICLILCKNEGQSQIIGQHIGSQTLSCGNIGTVAKNSFSSFQNPGLLAKGQGTSISFSQEIPFLQTALILSTLSVQTEFKSTPLEASFIQLGNSFYKQQLISLASAKELGEKLSLGIGLHYLISQQYQLPTLGNALGSIGLTFKLNKKLTLASHVMNLTGAQYKSEKREDVPQIMRIGLAYQLTQNVLILVEQEKMLLQNRRSKLGFIYLLDPKLELRGGALFKPQVWTFGLNLKTSKMRWGLGVQQHQVLGISPNIELQWQLSK